MAPEGTYRTEYRYRNDTYRSPTIFLRYYIHHSLDRVVLVPAHVDQHGAVLQEPVRLRR
jgi:hypothetical protein